eukprot:TRINITY_DN107352_c0_g1_i1.p1 TRINITY_DN107352_c0_g1~~TRINITY_DN107352_c0_g1_i1.p1  ORF type:complete len:520 (-),score=91.47 TRINITY_DN107352_c0_g1_i1:34-1593(-)
MLWPSAILCQVLALLVSSKRVHVTKETDCLARIKESNQKLEDFRLSDEDLGKIFAAPSECNWWESADCEAAWTARLMSDHFLRRSLVGPPTSEPTRYTPPAQQAVLTAMRTLFAEMHAAGQQNPTLDFTDKLFQMIDIPDGGSLKVKVFKAFADAFNRGSDDTLYRSKDVTTQPYQLSKWGKNVKQKIHDYNNLTYRDAEETTHVRALELRSGGLGTSFVYKLPPQGIVHELQSILDGINLGAAQSLEEVFTAAEKWIRDFVILHPYTDSNGRTARVALNILLLLNRLPPIVLAKQNDDMTSSPAELADRICEGMLYAKDLVSKLDVESAAAEAQASPTCCKALNKLDGNKYCVSVPSRMGCEKYSDLQQSKRYLPWQNGISGKTCGIAQAEGLCTGASKVKPEEKKRCCCFNGEVTSMPKWASAEGICLPDVGPSTLYQDTWNLVRAESSTECQEAGEALYHIDRRLGRCLSAKAQSSVLPALVKRRVIMRMYFCDASQGLHHRDCDCRWADGDECKS